MGKAVRSRYVFGNLPLRVGPSIAVPTPKASFTLVVKLQKRFNFSDSVKRHLQFVESRVLAEDGAVHSGDLSPSCFNSHLVGARRS